jgi:alpha-L-rhamnosidase
MERIANVLGKPEDARLYASKKLQLQEKIHETFFDDATNTYATGTQIDLAFPMIAGVVPANKLEAVENSLYHETKVTWDGHLATGLVGLPVLTEWGVENNAADFMYSMLKKRDYPGFLYMIDNGATTTWEHWDGARSRIHNCYNGIGSWFYQAVGGIRKVENVPAYRKVRIQPQIPDGVTWANTSQETPYGKLMVNWTVNDNQLETELEIPVGAEAEMILPTGDMESVKVNDEKPEEATIHAFKGQEKVRLNLGSGVYHILSGLDLED